MLFFTRLHFPAFSKNDIQKHIEKILNHPQTLSRNPEEYKKLLQLRAVVDKMSASLHQLKGIDSTVPWEMFELKALDLIKKRLNFQDLTRDDINSLRNAYEAGKVRLVNDKTINNLTSALFILSNSILALSAGMTMIAACAMTTGPIGMALLGVALAFIAAAVLVMTAYSIYVDARQLANKQSKEIEEMIEFVAPTEPSNLHSDLPTDQFSAQMN
ncbi:hypothetical protein EAS68_04045 [Legionella jordanis]|uniref:hypothetical protein n=1 Tax=Legionella jordanis TaxID=456 RepID=UPI000EFFEDFB|nr:hypothetical protein [Legionella jordanis]RMX21348.1 hypothetical protein EAS68_04045 [Legionella jordanis]